MALTDNCLEKLSGIAVAGGALAASTLLGVPIATGLIEFLTGGGQLALAVKADQRDRCEGYVKKVKKDVAAGYEAWLTRECGDDWQQRADVQAALAEFDRVLPSIKPTATDIAVAGHDEKNLVVLLLHRLPERSLFRQSQTTAGVFSALIIGTYGLIRSDPVFLAELTSFSFERVFDELTAIRAQLSAADRVQHEILESQKRMEARMLDERGIHPRNLEGIFRAVGRDTAISPERYEAELAAAIEALIARAADPVKALNDGETVVSAIRAARERLARLDVEGALSQLRTARHEERDAREAHRRGGARLAIEEADILRELFRHDEAIALYDEACLVDPDNLHALRMAGRARLAARPLSEVVEAFHRFLRSAERLGDDREVSVGWNEIGDVKVAQGDLPGALAAHQAGMTIAEKLVADDPTNAQRRRDLAVSHWRIGDVKVAQGDLAGALAAYQTGMTIAEKLAADDPANAQWQRDLSVSHERIGDVKVAQGDLAGALAAYRAGMTIAEKLTADDPANAEWQRDLIVSHVKLAETGASPAAEYRVALAIARRLQETGRLAPADEWMVQDLESRLEAAEGAGVQ